MEYTSIHMLDHAKSPDELTGLPTNGCSGIAAMTMAYLMSVLVSAFVAARMIARMKSYSRA